LLIKQIFKILTSLLKIALKKNVSFLVLCYILTASDYVCGGLNAFYKG